MKILVSITISCMIALVVRSAWAAPTVVTARPWALGVSQDQQQNAMQLYAAGNVELMEARFVQALAKYREAVKYWDHPAIRFNMAVCLINLGQLVEARNSLELSLSYGAVAMGDELYRQGLSYLNLLDRQLSKLIVNCQDDLAKVTLDGKHLLACPGKEVRYVVPGVHQIVAKRTGYAISSEVVVVTPGKSSVHDIKLIALEAPRHIRQGWAPWKPLALLGFGGVTVGFGAIVYTVSGSHILSDDQIRTCRDLMNTDLVDQCYRRSDRFRSERIGALSLLAVGGATFVLGALTLPFSQFGTTGRLAPVVTPRAGGLTLAMIGIF